MILVETMRLARFLYRQRIGGFSPPDAPHMDQETLDVFTRHLNQASSYLEFGSGGSTLCADKLGVATLTVECDSFYARVVRRSLSSGTSVKIIDVPIGLTREWGQPVFTKPTPVRLKQWHHYSVAPFGNIEASGNFPEFVLVDGRFRRACALQTAVHAARAGAAVSILIDDYAGRPHYSMVERYLGEPQRFGRSALFNIPSTGPVSMPDDAVLAEAASDYR